MRYEAVLDAEGRPRTQEGPGGVLQVRCMDTALPEDQRHALWRPASEVLQVAEYPEVVAQTPTCPYCRNGVSAEVVGCPICGMVHCAECWHSNSHRCAVYGCTGEGTGVPGDVMQPREYPAVDEVGPQEVQVELEPAQAPREVTPAEVTPEVPLTEDAELIQEALEIRRRRADRAANRVDQVRERLEQAQAELDRTMARAEETREAVGDQQAEEEEEEGEDEAGAWVERVGSNMWSEFKLFMWTVGLCGFAGMCFMGVNPIIGGLIGTGGIVWWWVMLDKRAEVRRREAAGEESSEEARRLLQAQRGDRGRWW